MSVWMPVFRSEIVRVASKGELCFSAEYGGFFCSYWLIHQGKKAHSADCLISLPNALRASQLNDDDDPGDGDAGAGNGPHFATTVTKHMAGTPLSASRIGCVMAYT